MQVWVIHVGDNECWYHSLDEFVLDIVHRLYYTRRHWTLIKLKWHQYCSHFCGEICNSGNEAKKSAAPPFTCLLQRNLNVSIMLLRVISLRHDWLISAGFGLDWRWRDTVTVCHTYVPPLTCFATGKALLGLNVNTDSQSVGVSVWNPTRKLNLMCELHLDFHLHAHIPFHHINVTTWTHIRILKHTEEFLSRAVLRNSSSIVDTQSYAQLCDVWREQQISLPVKTDCVYIHFRRPKHVT